MVFMHQEGRQLLPRWGSSEIWGSEGRARSTAQEGGSGRKPGDGRARLHPELKQVT